MVSLPIVLASNASIPKTLAPGLIAVFAGGTSGIGEETLKKLAKLVVKPKFYIIGRSTSAAERIIAECRVLNPDGEYLFLQKELDVMKNIEEVCEEIKSKEKFINLLVLSAGGPDLSRSLTSEGLHRLFALHFYGRSLFIQCLLPLLHAAPSGTLKRVLSIASGSYEGVIQMNDLPALKIPLSQLRGHAASTLTLVFQHLAIENPDVSIVTDHPGTVVTPSMQQIKGILGFIVRAAIFSVGRWITVPLSESAERHVFLATSDSFKSKSGDAKGAPLVEGLETHGGVDGDKGSGLYSVNWECEGPGETAIKLLNNYHADGTADKVWEHCQGELERVKREERGA